MANRSITTNIRESGKPLEALEYLCERMSIARAGIYRLAMLDMARREGWTPSASPLRATAGTEGLEQEE